MLGRIIVAILCFCGGIVGIRLTIVGIRDSFDAGDYIFTGMFALLTLVGMALILLGIVIVCGGGVI